MSPPVSFLAASLRWHDNGRPSTTRIEAPPSSREGLRHSTWHGLRWAATLSQPEHHPSATYKRLSPCEWTYRPQRRSRDRPGPGPEHEMASLEVSDGVRRRPMSSATADPTADRLPGDSKPSRGSRVRHRALRSRPSAAGPGELTGEGTWKAGRRGFCEEGVERDRPTHPVPGDDPGRSAPGVGGHP